MTTYKIYEKINNNTVLRMVTDNKEQAKKYTKYANNHYKTVWMRKEKD